MLKGHTKIELTNVKTGEVKTYEKDNFVTNFFRDAMQPCGVYGCYHDYFIQNGPTAQSALLELTRGLALFDSALPNDPDEYTLPAGVNMVGRGTDAAYNGQDTTLGSYNASESVIQNDGTSVGYRFVWDFTTQQANGTIKSICLTPTFSARIGFGKSNVITDNAKDQLWSKEFSRNYGRQAAYPKYTENSGQKDAVWLDFSGNRLLKVTSGFTNNSRSAGNLFVDKNIIISEYRIPINNRSIFDSYSESERTSMAPRKTYTVSMPEELQALCTDTSVYRAFETRVDQKNGTLSILLLYGANCSIPADGTIYAWEISLKDMTSSVKTYTNNTGYIIGNNQSYQGMDWHCMYELDDYILIHIPKSTGAQKLCCINKKSGECKGITLMDGSAIPFKDSNRLEKNHLKNGNLLICGNYNYLDTAKVTKYFIVDCVTGTLKNIEPSNNYESVGYDRSSGHLYDYVIGTGDRKYAMIQAGRACLYPFVFFTINNLDAPIVKTDEQMMKITYELSKE